MKNNKKKFSLIKFLGLWPILGLVYLLVIREGEKPQVTPTQPKQSVERSYAKAVKVEGETYLSDPNFKGNKRIPNFSSAKKIHKKLDNLGVTEEMYCGCKFSDNKISKNAECGLKHRKNEGRAYRIEYEHIVPFENQLGHTTQWKVGSPACNGKKGRVCAAKVFPHMEADLWNLQPSGGEMNADRSNYSYAVIGGARGAYGQCNFKVENRKAEPRDEVKALVAFTYMYMQESYARHLKTNYISDKNRKMFEAWSKYPLKKYQCDWARRVVEVQKNRNDFLLEACSRSNL